MDEYYSTVNVILSRVIIINIDRRDSRDRFIVASHEGYLGV